MSIDLAVQNALNSTAQPIQDQNGNSSGLSIGTAATVCTQDLAMNSNQFYLTTASNPWHLLGYTTTGDTDFWIYHAQLAFQQGPQSNPTTIVLLTPSGMQVNGTLSVSGSFSVPNISGNPPSSANLQNVQVDVNTGILYYD